MRWGWDPCGRPGECEIHQHLYKRCFAIVRAGAVGDVGVQDS